MVTFNSTKKKNTGGGNPSYVGNNQSGYSAESGSGEKNKGGILGGLGYVGAGLAAGIGSVGEGIIDLLLAGGGLLTGNVDYAKHVFKDNTVGNWFADVTEDFNPGTGWEFAGNVTHGLGQSSVFLLNLIPGLGQLGTAAFFAGVGSQGISSAAATTGDVGLKEVGYGIVSGAVEGALEKALGGMGKAVKTLGGSTMKNITKTAVRKGLVKQVLSDAAGEFGEEFASEYIDTFLQRGFQIDPNKTTSLRDALYAGAVGFTSGAVSAGSANVIKAIGNERVGDRIVKSGNSQTLVNTATKVADKLAAQGTNWDRASEWIKALRGQVDAYSKLSESEKTGMRGKTILGEMKSSLFFAETQSTFDLVKKSIQNSDEQTRATFAEYINKSVEKSKRNGKDYTAADIAKDTDGVAWQLAIYKFVPSLFDLDGALADMQQESEIADVVAKQGGEVAQGANDVNPSSVADATASPEGEALAMPQMAGARPAMQFDLDENAVNLRSEAINAKGEQTGAETVQDETAGASPRPTGEFNGEVDLERAKRDAERIIEWERKEAPTADELNRVRGAVKNFDSLSGDRQRAIVRMVRSGKNIDEGVIRGVSNIMAITNKKGAVLAPDVEIRFAEFGKDSTRRGIKTEVGGKTVILLNANATYKDTIRGTIAHEIVHYLENRKGYKALAEYAMKHAKADKVAKVRETYRKEYTNEERKANPNATEEEIAARVDEKMRDEAAVNSEIVGNVVAELLGNEKFLKRYAQMGEEQSSVVKRIERFVKGIANALKEKDEETGAVAAKMMELVDKALGSEVEGEKTGEKYSVIQKDGKYYTPTDEEIIKNHPTINGVIINDAEYSEGHKLPDDEYKAYQKKQVEKAKEVAGTYTNKDTAYSNEYGFINAEFGTKAIKKGRSYGGIALYDILPYVPRIFENAVVIDTKPDDKSDINIKGIVNLVGCAILNNKYIAVVKLNVKEYSNDEAKIYDNRVIEIEELTVVERVSHQDVKTPSDHPSSAVSSKYIIAKFREFVNTSDKKSSDAAYMAAVESGDMETAQRMVDEAAKKAGYTVKAYHGTDNEFTLFDKNKIMSNTGKAFYGTGFYFSTSEHDANNYGNKIMPVYLRVGKTLDLDSSTWTYDLGIEQKKSKVEVEKTHIEQAPKGFINLHYTTKDAPNIWKSISNVSPMQLTDDETGKKFVEKKLNPESSILPRDIKNLSELARNNGYNSIKGAGTNIGDIGAEYVLFDKQNIKSADPVTYDDDGKVIPLSKRFNKFEPDIRYDLDPEAVEREAKRLTPKTDVKGQEVSDEFFEAAVARARKEQNLSAEERRQLAQERNKEAVEKRKTKFEKLLSRAMSIQNQIEKLRKNATDTESKAKLKKLKKDFNDVLGDLGALQIDLRQMGYDLSAEQRLIERQKKQIEDQGEQILTLKKQNRNLKRAEREDQIIKMVETRENARMAELFAKQKAEITSVYSEDEIKRELRNMLDKGLIPQFFGGDYQPKLSKAKIEAISRYIAIQLNTTGSAEKAEAQGLIRVAALDIVRNIKFTEEDSKTKITLDEIADAESREYFVDAISAKLEQMVRNAGELNPYAELQRKYNNLKAEIKAEIKNNEGEAWGREFPKVVAEAKRMRNFAVNKKNMAVDGVQEVLKAFASLTDESGRLYSGRVDGVMQAALTFFEAEAMRTNSERGQVDKDNKIADDSMIWNIDPDLKDAIELFVQMRKGREGTLMNSQELKLVREILSGMRTSLERYNKEKIGGKFVDIDRAAGEKVRFMQTDVESKTFTSKLLNSKLGRAFRNAYFYEVLSPAAVFDSLDGYEIGGLLSTLYRDIRMAAQSAIDMKARLKDPFVRYVDDKENAWKDEKGHSRSFRQKLNEKKISVDGVNITLGEAINLYMLTKREHAHLGLKEGGFVTYDENGVKVAKIRIPDIEIARSNLYNQFDATDRKFIEMAENFFNKTASKIKEEADIEIYGYSKNSEGYYVPIVRDHYARNNGVTDVRQSISNFATVNNKSFTKDLVRNAKPLEGQNILGLIKTHADGLADYANLYMPLKAFDRVYNRGVSIDGGEVTTLREQLNEEWNGAHKYFTKLFKDIQGVRDGDPPSNVDKVASWIRSNWVASVLGANLKVVCTQTTSLGAATQIIDAKYVTKASWIITPGTGFAKGVKEIAERADKYSKTIFSRSFDAGAVKAQGNLDKIGNIAKGASTLIGIQDRKVCIALFHAAELSVEASTGHKVGTEENSVLAAKLVDEAILTTQAMESQAEKSNLQRANSELAKLFSIFTSDSVKNLSHLISNISRYAAHKNRAKNGDARYESELKKDGKAARRSMRTMLITGVMLGVITQGFKYLYGKEEEDEKKLQDFAVDIVSSTVNVFPIISEIVDKIAFDYDMSVNVLDVVNDTLETFGDSFELMGKAMGGEYVSGQAIGKSAINVSKSAFSLFGIPVAPAERTITGLLRRFFPSAIYGYDSMMSNPSYSADLQAAVKSGDDALAEHILETIYKNEATGVYSTPELEEVARLYGLGNTSVIPQKIGTTVNDIKLDRKQRAQFEKIYGEASAKVNELIRSEYYAELDDGQRAKAIKNLYSLYYNRAAAEVAGVEWSNAQAYSRLTDNLSALFAAQAYKSGLTEYKNMRGKIVSVKDQFVKYVEGLRLNDANKLVVLYANGYRDAKTKKKMLAYINSLSISEEEKTRMAERLGFAIENGKVVEKKEELEVRAE